MESVNLRQYAAQKVTADGNLSALEGNGAGVSDNSGTNLLLGDGCITCQAVDQPGLQAGQRPVSHLVRQINALQEDTEIKG